jgi:hypothetical protein
MRFTPKLEATKECKFVAGKVGDIHDSLRPNKRESRLNEGKKREERVAWKTTERGETRVDVCISFEIKPKCISAAQRYGQIVPKEGIEGH